MACNSTKNAATNGQSYVLNGAADSACYAIGISYGNGLKEQMKVFPGGGVNLDALAEGFLKAIRSDSLALLLTPEEAQAYIQAYIMGIQVKEAMAEKEKGEQFLAANKTQEGVITTESGLQYKIIKQGEGEIPTAEDQVKVHYTGKLLDGTTFDSSVQRGEPAVFGVKQVIPGWTEVLQLMPVGSKYEVWIPSELGYGTQGAGQMIKPNNVLNFEVELLEIVK
ncbi:MAG: FKBP-type peptidyl-prolyl cis-trans isomerase [Tannerella sp.]|nr:FKBP-type peptidyl-prolyl cis-trans isomerase [Tannerella sp.]